MKPLKVQYSLLSLLTCAFLVFYFLDRGQISGHFTKKEIKTNTVSNFNKNVTTVDEVIKIVD